MLHKCKELAFLIVFREGFTQFRDMSTIGAGFGSPRYVAVRVILENGEVCRHSLYMIEIPFLFKQGKLIAQYFYVGVCTNRLWHK